MAKAKRTIIVPNEEKFGPAPIPYGILSGTGATDYDGNEDAEYVVAIKLDKDMEKFFRKQVLEFWEENKPADAADKPANWENIVRDGTLYARTKKHWDDGSTTKITIVNHKGVKLDPDEFGHPTDGSEGRVAVTLTIYKSGKKSGVSIYLSAVKFTKYVPYEGGGAAFGEEDGEVEAGHEFKEEKPKKKKKKKK